MRQMMTILTEFGVGEQDRSSDSEDYLQGRRFHCVIRSRVGMGSGHRIVKWFTVWREC